ncbi:MAG: YggU family protein [Deltaproteobacteria bacterium]|nr:YggU family protein [Deltaproteobacteria bacterium]
MDLKATPKGVSLPVLVQPRASRDEIVGIQDGRLKIRLTAPPVRGRANEALVALLAKRLKVAKSKIIIVAGHKSRRKEMVVEGVSAAEIENLLGG